MILQCQELLTMFGLPYITAPMEAEAQCAVMNELGLVDGVITDDSDTFLFGAQVVYRHFFQQNSWVDCYTMQTIKECIGFDRKVLSINIVVCFR